MVLGLAFSTMSGAMTSCLSREDAVRLYGGANAYDKSESGKIYHLKQNSTIYFYIDPAMPQEYKTIAYNSIFEANKVSSGIKFGVTADKTSKFVFTYTSGYINNDKTTNAMTWFWPDAKGEIYQAQIEFSGKAMSGRNFAYKQHTAIHELGHVLGLGHIKDQQMVGYTVMISPHPNEGKYQESTYDEFDRYNINWYYGK